ncbi:molybdopterin-dependent oxidoreductase [bacterium]|nr:molybdopterin-dependent oxidoreductase [candidate division CSSED10-310 bacterium]
MMAECIAELERTEPGGELSGSFRYFYRDLLDIRNTDGPDAIAGIVSSDISNEAAYLFQKFFRLILGTNNLIGTSGPEISWNASHATFNTIGMLPQSVRIDWIRKADVVCIFHTTLEHSRPDILDILIQNKDHTDQKIILWDPETSRLSDLADVHFNTSLQAESDLLRAILRTIHLHGGTDRQIIWRDNEGFQRLLKQCREYTPESVAERWAIPAERINQTALLFSRYQHIVTIIRNDDTPDYYRNAIVSDILNLIMATGHLGSPGNGIFWIFDTLNPLGISLTGISPDHLPGYVPISSSAGKTWFSECWKSPIPEKPGLSLSDLPEKLESGELKALIWLGKPPSKLFPPSVLSSGRLSRLKLLAGAGQVFEPGSRYWWPLAPAGSAGGTVINSDANLRKIKLHDVSDGYYSDWELPAHWLCDLKTAEEPLSFENILKDMVDCVPGFLNVSPRSVLSGESQPVLADTELPSILIPDDFSIGDLPGIRFQIRENNSRADVARDEIPLYFKKIEPGLAVIPPEISRLLNKTITTVVHIHPSRAEHFGLADAGRIRIETSGGTLFGLCHITETAPEGCAILRYREPEDIFPILASPESCGSARLHGIDISE